MLTFTIVLEPLSCISNRKISPLVILPWNSRIQKAPVCSRSQLEIASTTNRNLSKERFITELITSDLAFFQTHTAPTERKGLTQLGGTTWDTIHCKRGLYLYLYKGWRLSLTQKVAILQHFYFNIKFNFSKIYV